MTECVYIEGPLGPFLIPAEPPETKRICEALSKQVWAGEYEHPELPVEGIHNILDIGAGWGAFAVWARKRWPASNIYSYEPHAEAFEMLRQNSPGGPSWEGRAVAVTTQPEAYLAVNEDWGACSTYQVPKEHPTARDVVVLHPKELPPADLLKIDAEGVEVEVLSSYPWMSGLKSVLYEFHNLEHKQRLREICGGFGLRQLTEEKERTYGTSVWVRP